MSGFTPDWLALREPFDARARNARVLDAVVGLLENRPVLEIVDLACGTGSTLRALGPHLSRHQHWRLIDSDRALLASAAAGPVPDGATMTVTPLDLNRDLETAFAADADLVTASALLDLVSATWLDRLAAKIAARAVPFYAALTYDGRVEFAPPDPFDQAVIEAFNAHQRTDKGFGPALGPAAARTAIERFRALGFRVVHGASDWRIGPHDRPMQEALLSGWATAAGATGRLSPSRLAAWRLGRHDALAAGLSSIMVGHVDFLACPIGTR
ncbi:MAG: class I SAM-dependent methyltransferase [Pseudolabrys sp.]|nr:class I SAM-dependent methyltransferase [Pseudolabrys sp.]